MNPSNELITTGIALALCIIPAYALLRLLFLIVPSLKEPAMTYCVAVFIALSCCVCYYQSVKPNAIGHGGSPFNTMTFQALSKHSTHFHQMYNCWQTRVGGMWIFGKVLDANIKDGQLSVEQYQHLFGMYQMSWFAVLCGLLIWHFKRWSWWIIPLCYTGLAYMDSCTPWWHHFPWDNPAIVFFTAAWMLWSRGWYKTMVATMLIGCVFKETAIIPAMLFLFPREAQSSPASRWRQRLGWLGLCGLLFLAWKIAIGYAVFGKFYVLTQHVFYARPQYTTSSLPATVLNLLSIVDRGWNSFLLICGGSFLVSLLFGGKYRPYWVLLLVFAVLSSLELNTFVEWRTFGEVVPLSAFILLEIFKSSTPDHK